MANKQNAPFHVPVRMRRRALGLAVLLLALYVFVPQVGNLSSSWQALLSARPEFVALACIGMAGTYICAATTYKLLAKHLLAFWSTVIVEVSGSFVNRLLPAGIGGMGLNAQYLRRQGHTLQEALAVVGVNNALGVLGNGLVIAGSLIYKQDMSLARLHVPAPSWPLLVGAGIALVVLLANLLTFEHLRTVLSNGIGGVMHALAGYRRHWWRLVAALLSSIALTLLHVLMLWSAARAIGLSLPVIAYVIVFSAGTFAGSITPTPGGLVGVEAGLTASLVAYGVQPGQALATALLFRLVNYWLPLVPGSLAYVTIRKRLRV